MDFYERARKARKSKKRIIYSNREYEAEQDFLFTIARRISQEIQDGLMKCIESNNFFYNTGTFGHKTDFRYETSVKICFQYGNANGYSFSNYDSRREVDRSEGIVLYRYYDSDYSDIWDVYYIITCYLSDTKYILLYILKILKKDFTDIFIEATWGEEYCAYSHKGSFVDGLKMTKPLIEKIMDKITVKDNGKVHGAVWFEITVEVDCDKKGNI